MSRREDISFQLVELQEQINDLQAELEEIDDAEEAHADDVFDARRDDAQSRAADMNETLRDIGSMT